MQRDAVYTNGAIAVKERELLKDRLYKMCAMSAEEAFRLLTESGFGGGAAEDVHGFEAAVAAEERALDEFIRTFAPSDAELSYLLSERDFHNAKSILKARHLGRSAEGMLAPDGMIPAARIEKCIADGDFRALGEELGGAAERASAYLQDDKTTSASGAEIGKIFQEAYFRYLAKACSKNKLLRRLIAERVDRINLLTAFRSPNRETAEAQYVSGGSLKKERLALVFGEEERALRYFSATPYAQFVKSCFAAKNAGAPYSAAERELSSIETDFLSRNKYELSGNLSFLYYALRRRAEISNVRIVLVCLTAGMAEREIAARLRTA